MGSLTEMSASVTTVPASRSFETTGRTNSPGAVTLAQSEFEHLFLARYCQGVYN